MIRTYQPLPALLICAALTANAQVSVVPKVFLEGPYNPGIGLMADSLRTLAVFPLTEPYTALGYTFVGGGGESVLPTVLSVTGNDAVVDWVVVELRSSTDPGRRIAARCGLLQRDGDVRGVDNVSALGFSVPTGDYYIVVRHRNHLALMSGSPIALSASAAAIDLSDPETDVWFNGMRKSVGSVMVMYAGDVTFDGRVKYTGAGNDRDPILVTVGSTTPNNAVETYNNRDVNMDGTVKYTGSGNDRDRILQNVGGTTPNAVRDDYLPEDTLALRTRVHVVDSLDWSLDSTASNLLDLTTLVYGFTGPVPDVLPDDIVVGTEGFGYLRKVTAVSNAGSVMTLQTVQASLSDVFSQGAMGFSVSDQLDSNQVSSFAQGLMPTNGFSTPDVQLGLSARLEDIIVDFDYDFNPKAVFSLSGLVSADLAIRDITAKVTGKLVITGSGAQTFVESEERTLRTWVKSILIPVGPVVVPVIVVTQLKLVVSLSATLGAQVTLAIPLSLELDMDAGAVYTNGAWQDITNWQITASSLSVLPSSPSVEASLVGFAGLALESKIYGVAGPSVSVGPSVHAAFAANASLDWNYAVTTNATGNIGIKAKFMDLLNLDESYTRNIALAGTLAPDSMQIVSGNGQYGLPGQQLAQPVRVQVKKKYDPWIGPNEYYGVPDARVRFVVTSGGGSAAQAVVVTDANGFAETFWTLGAAGGQELSATVLKADGNAVDAPLLFTAQAGTIHSTTAYAGSLSTNVPSYSDGSCCWDWGGGLYTYQMQVATHFIMRNWTQ